MTVAGEFLLAVRDIASLQEKLSAVGEGVFHRVVVEVLVDLVAAEMPAARGLGGNRERVLHPAAFIDVVDQEIAVTAAAGPKEGMEAFDLPKQLIGAGWPWIAVTSGLRTSPAIGPQQRYVADFAVANVIEQLTRATQCRHIRPTPTFRPMRSDRSASANILRVLGPSTVTGFSMNTLSRFSMA